MREMIIREKKLKVELRAKECSVYKLKVGEHVLVELQQSTERALVYSTFAQNNTSYIIDSIRMFGIGNIPFEMQRKAVETFKKDHNPQVLVSLPSISETPLYGTGQYGFEMITKDGIVLFPAECEKELMNIVVNSGTKMWDRLVSWFEDQQRSYGIYTVDNVKVKSCEELATKFMWQHGLNDECLTYEDSATRNIKIGLETFGAVLLTIIFVVGTQLAFNFYRTPIPAITHTAIVLAVLECFALPLWIAYNQWKKRTEDISVFMRMLKYVPYIFGFNFVFCMIIGMIFIK